MKAVKVKNTEKIIKAAREKQLVMCKGKAHKALRFFSRNFTGQRHWHNKSKVLKGGEKKTYNYEYSTLQDFIQNFRRFRVSHTSKS